MIMKHASETRPNRLHPDIVLRPGTPADAYLVFEIFERTLADLLKRMDAGESTTPSDPQALSEMWQDRRSLYEHLGIFADEFWIAERRGRPIGFSRSIIRDGHQQLTELFVLPEEQTGGVGRALIAKALPNNEVRYRFILATMDQRAQALYQKAGALPRFPVTYFGRKPEVVEFESDLTFTAVSGESKDILSILGYLDRAVLNFRRDKEHVWLLKDRQGFLYYRGESPVGYGYLGKRNGPFAVLDANDLRTVLAHAETRAAELGYQRIGLELPAINQVAVDHVVQRGYWQDQLETVFMSSHPFGRFENYIFCNPPFFL